MAKSKLYGKVASGEFYRKAVARLMEEADPKIRGANLNRAEPHLEQFNKTSREFFLSGR